MRIRTALLMALTAAFLSACHSHDTEPRTSTSTRAGEPQSTVRHEVDAVDPYIVNVQGAQTSLAEADALRQLRGYAIDKKLTYRIRTFRTFDSTPVADASTSPQPVRAEITLYRGRDIVRTFNFVPKDNHNLALLGE